MKIKTLQDLRSFVFSMEELKKISKALNRLDVHQCNIGELTPKQKKRETRLEQRAHEIANLYGLESYHQTDPRGCSLYLIEDTIGDYSKGIAII